MNETIGIYVVAAVIALVLLLVVVGVVAQYRRRKELLAWTRMRGYAHQSAADRKMDVRFCDLECLRRGDNRYAYDTVTGQWNGRPFVAFTYRYRIGHGKNSRVVHFTMLGLKPQKALKALSIRREGMFDKVAALFGAKDVQLGSPEFDRHFHVTSEDPDWARQLLHPMAQQYLLADSPYQIASCGDYLFAWDMRVWRAARYEQAAEYLSGLLQRMGH